HTRSYGDWSSDVCSSDLRRTARRSSLEHSCRPPKLEAGRPSATSAARMRPPPAIDLHISRFHSAGPLRLRRSRKELAMKRLILRSEERRVGKGWSYWRAK